jgi:2'-5' RNA ligase
LALQRALAATLDELGIRRDTAGPYTPHITLLYDDVAIPEQPVAAVTWNVNEFRLIDRRRGQHEFRVLGRWALG